MNRLKKQAALQIKIIGDTGEEVVTNKLLFRVIVSGLPKGEEYFDNGKYDFEKANIDIYKLNRLVLQYVKKYIKTNFPNIDVNTITLYNFGNPHTPEVDWEYNGFIIHTVFTYEAETNNK